MARIKSDELPWETDEETVAVDLFLDSGAYSAWSRSDDSLSVKEYIRYVKRNQKLLWGYVNMDVIPGVFGQRRTQEQVEHSAKQGYKNLQIIKDAGLKPIPVFHQGERMYWLEKMLADGETYIGLSSIKESNSPEQRAWLDQIFSAITDKQGRPLIHTHGFGITNPTLLFRYPWFTVDSTTWSLTPGYGQIIIPAYVNDKPDWLRTPVRIVVSGVQHKSSSSNKKQFEAMGPVMYKAVRHFLEDIVGVSISDVRYDTGARRKCLLVYYLHLMEHLKQVRFTGRSHSLTHQLSSLKGGNPMNMLPLKIMFATALNRQWSQELNETGARTRLLSYYELRDKPDAILSEYVNNGIVTVKSTKPNQQSKKRRDWKSEAYHNHRRLALVARLENYDADTPDIPD